MCWKHPAGPCPGPGPTGWTGYHQERRVGKPGALSAGPPKALRFSAAQNSWLQKWVAGSLNEALVSGFQVRLFAWLILSPNFSGPGVGWATCLLDMFKKCITMVHAHVDFFFSKSVLVGAVLGTGITGITRIPKPCIAGIQASCGQRLRHVLRINPWFDWWCTFVMKPIVLWAEQVSRTCSWSKQKKIYYIVLYYIILYYILLYYIILYYIILYCIILYYIVLYYIILYYIILYYIVLYYIILYYIILYCITLYHIILYYIILYYIILYYIILYCIILYYIILYCIILYYIII